MSQIEKLQLRHLFTHVFIIAIPIHYTESPYHLAVVPGVWYPVFLDFILPKPHANSTVFDFLVIFRSFCVYSLVPGVWHFFWTEQSMMIWFSSSTGSNCFIPVPKRLPIPAAMISNVVFIIFLFSFLIKQSTFQSEVSF